MVIIAVLAPLLFWIIGYFLSFIYFGSRFFDFKPLSLFKNLYPKKINIVLILFPFLSAILTAVIMIVVDSLGSSYYFLCDDECMLVPVFYLPLLWLLSAVLLLLILVMILLMPNAFGLKSRMKTLAFYFAHHLYTFVFFLLIVAAIEIVD